MRKATYHPDIYGPSVPLAIIRFFEKELRSIAKSPSRTLLMERFRIHYGNTVTGRAWGDHDEGYISLSDGDLPVLITLFNRTSDNGNAILMTNIVKIESALGRSVIYRHPRFHTHNEEPPQVEEGSAPARTPRKVSLARNDRR